MQTDSQITQKLKEPVEYFFSNMSLFKTKTNKQTKEHK